MYQSFVTYMIPQISLKFKCSSLSDLLPEHPDGLLFDPGDLHLTDGEHLRHPILGQSVEIPQGDDAFFPLRQLPDGLAQGDLYQHPLLGLCIRQDVFQGEALLAALPGDGFHLKGGGLRDSDLLGRKPQLLGKL